MDLTQAKLPPRKFASPASTRRTTPPPISSSSRTSSAFPRPTSPPSPTACRTSARPARRNSQLPSRQPLRHRCLRQRRRQAADRLGRRKKLHRPSFLASQYSLFAKVQQLPGLLPAKSSNGKSVFQYNNAGIGIQVSWPIFDRALKDKAAESAADAVHAFAEANNARIKDQEGHASSRARLPSSPPRPTSPTSSSSSPPSSSPPFRPSYRPPPPTPTPLSAPQRSGHRRDRRARQVHRSLELPLRSPASTGATHALARQSRLLAACRRRLTCSCSSSRHAVILKSHHPERSEVGGPLYLPSLLLFFLSFPQGICFSTPPLDAIPFRINELVK